METLPIEFVMYITGDDKKTVEKRFNRWNSKVKCSSCEVNLCDETGICSICEQETLNNKLEEKL